MYPYKPRKIINYHYKVARSSVRTYAGPKYQNELNKKRSDDNDALLLNIKSLLF